MVKQLDPPKETDTTNMNFDLPTLKVSRKRFDTPMSPKKRHLWNLYQSYQRVYGEDFDSFTKQLEFESSFERVNGFISIPLDNLKEEDYLILDESITEEIEENIDVVNLLSDFDFDTASMYSDEVDEYCCFSEISEPLYGHFSPLMSPIKNSDQCLCGFGFCDTHPEKYSKLFNNVNNSLHMKKESELELVIESDWINPYSQMVEPQYIATLVEDICWSMFIVGSKPTIKSIVQGVGTFIKLRYKGSILYDTYKIMYLKYCSRVFNVDISNIESLVDLNVENDYIDKAKDLLGAYKALNKHPFFKKLYKCAMYGISLDIFSKIGMSMDTLGYSAMEVAFLKKKFYSKSDFIYTLLDTVVYILEQGIYVFKTGDISSIVHSGTVYSELFEQSNELKRKARLLNNSEAHGFDEFSFRNELDTIIEKFQSIKKHSGNLDKFDKDCVKFHLDALLMLKDDIVTMNACRQMRNLPFGVLIVGDSGIGKSTLVEYIYKFFGNLRGLPTDDYYKYVHNYMANFWNLFKTSCYCIVFDDVAVESPALMDNSSVKELIQVMNPVPFCPDQAAIEDKGKTPCKAELVIATTNVKHMNTFHYFSFPSAVQRRFPYIITPKVHPHLTNDMGMLDSSKVIEDVEYQDLWTFKIEKVIPKKIDAHDSRSLADLEIVHESLDQRGFFTWLRDAILAHDANNKRVKTSISKLKNAKNCLCCNLPDQMCLNIQNDFVYFTSSVFSDVYEAWKCSYLCRFFNYIKFLIYMLLVTFKIGDTCLNKYNAMNAYCESIDLRRKFYSIGENVKTKLSIPNVSLLLGAATTCLLMCKIYNKVNLKVEGNDISTVGSDLPNDKKETKRENAWYKNDFVLSECVLSRQITSSLSSTFDDFIGRISENCVLFKLKHETDDSLVKYVRMVCLRGNLYLTNAHNFVKTSNNLYKGKFIHKNNHTICGNIDIQIGECDIFRIMNKDLVIVKILNVPPKKDILKYFLPKTTPLICKGVLLRREQNGTIHRNPIDNIKLLQSTHLNEEKIGSIKVDLWCGIANNQTDVGDCGSLLIAQTEKGYCCLGIHIGSDKEVLRRVCSNAFSIEDFPHIFQEATIEGSDYSMISSETIQRNVTDLHPKSVFRYIPEGCAEVYGSFTGFRNKSKSKVEPTILIHALDKYGYKIKHGKPVMNDYRPWRIGALDMLSPITQLNNNIYDKVTNDFISRILSKLPAERINQLCVVNAKIAINGKPGVSFVDKINRNTSAGNPWKKSKRHLLLNLTPDEEYDFPVTMNDEIMQRVDTILNRYREGKRSYPNFCAHLKDEATTFKKIMLAKSRIFGGAPVDWTIIVRMYLLTMVKLIQEEQEVFESGPGLIVQSLEWHQLHEYLTHFGEDTIIAGDYKAYDKKMSPIEILSAFKVLISCMKKSENFKPEDEIILWCIAHDTCMALYEFNGDLVMFYGSNPSGHPLTVIINGIVGSLRMRYSYEILKPKDCDYQFDEYVHLRTYGDDNIMNVSKDIPWFNHTSIAEVLSDVGITYTMADKEAESKPYIRIDESSFLKRTFRYDNDLKCYMAPIEHDSIEKSLTTWVKSKSIPREAQAIAIISTAIREYFFYGKSVFEEKREMLINIVDECELHNWVDESTFPTWNELTEQFWNSSKHIVLSVQNDWLTRYLPTDTIRNIRDYSSPNQFDQETRYLNKYRRYISDKWIYKLHQFHLIYNTTRYGIIEIYNWYVIRLELLSLSVSRIRINTHSLFVRFPILCTCICSWAFSILATIGTFLLILMQLYKCYLFCILLYLLCIKYARNLIEFSFGVNIIFYIQILMFIIAC